MIKKHLSNIFSWKKDLKLRETTQIPNSAIHTHQIQKVGNYPLTPFDTKNKKKKNKKSGIKSDEETPIKHLRNNTETKFSYT